MTLVSLALLVALVAAIAIVLADSGLRWWSAFVAIASLRADLRGTADLPVLRHGRPTVVTTRVSYARPAPARQRAAA